MHLKLGKTFGFMSYGYLWYKPYDHKDIYAAIGDSGNIIYVNKEINTSVGVTGPFKPRIFDRVEFIGPKLLPAILTGKYFNAIVVCIQTTCKEKEYMNDVISIIEKSKAAYFASVDAEGKPEIRALLNLCNPQKYKALIGKSLIQDGENVELYFTTNTSSNKVTRIRNNPNVAVYFAEPDNFRGICVSGKAEEITDQKLTERFWKRSWTMYYPLGKTDPDYAIIKVTSTKIEGWYNLAKHIFGGQND